MAAVVFSAAQRDHSKLQKPPHTPAPESGAAAAATNTQRQERTAAAVTRACSSSRPRRLAAEPTDRRFLSACEGSWAATWTSEPLAKISAVHCAQTVHYAVAGGGGCRRCRTALHKPTLPATLPSRCRGRLF